MRRRLSAVLSQFEPLPLAFSGLRATRLVSTVPYVGMKEHYAVARVESGHSEWWSRGRVWRSAPGGLQLQGPGDVHRDVSRQGPIVYQIISFPTDTVERLAGKMVLRPTLDADDPLGAPFQRLHDAVQRRAERFELEVLTTEAIAALVAVGSWRSQETRPVRRALELLRERMAEAITLDDLAAYAGLDKYHLCRAFRRQIGLPPHSYLTRLRVMHAKRLLHAGVRPTEVAAQVGLYDQSQLNRHFRKLVGTTPGRYFAQVSASKRA